MRVTRLTGVFLTALHLAAASAAQAQHRETALLSNVSVEARDGSISVSIVTSDPPRYRATTLDRPPRIVLEFAGAEFAWRRSPLTVTAEPLREIRGSQHRKGVARIVIELTKKSEYRLDPQPGGLRVVFPSSGVADAGAAALPGPSAPAAPAPAAAVPPGPAGGPASAPPSGNPVLFGVILGERGWIAYIEDPDTRQVSAYRVGDTVAGRTIEAIDDASVALKGREGSLRLHLSDDKPGSVKTRAR